MTKNGNAHEISVGQFAELATAVISNLPRDISTQEAQKWVNDRHALSLALRKALVVADTFTLTVDYGQSVEDAVKTGNYDWVDDKLTSRNFPATRRGIETVKVKIVHFRREMSLDEVLGELDKQGLRPATIEELLALGASQTDLQRQFLIVALGSVRRLPDGNRYVPALWGVHDRSAYVLQLGYGWRSHCRFLAVSK